MANNLVIVESNAKAKTIKKYLGKNFEVVASMGHLVDLPKSQMGIDIDNNFAPKYITIRGKGELLNKLRKLSGKAGSVYLATDPDREGEAISWHLAKALKLSDDKAIRISFNEITKKAVNDAVSNPRKIDIDLVNAQQARRLLDRLVGYKLSPLLWKKVKKGLSAGRVQSVATRLIVDREQEISDFNPEEYWTISLTLTSAENKDAKPFSAKFHGIGGKKVQISNKKQCDDILMQIKNKDIVITGVKYGEKKKSPSPPFITSTLQQEAHRKLNFTSKRTMQAAQQLYEGIDVSKNNTVGLITYMRTDSLRISSDAQNAALSYISEQYGEEYLPEKPRVYRLGKNAQDAHEAIRPTSMSYPPEKIATVLTADQLKLYKLVWDRFLASQMANAVYNTINADILINDVNFKAGGQSLKFPGYTKLYTSFEDQELQSVIPSLSDGQLLRLVKTEPKQHFTEPPPRYTEASLIKEMEANGIGRPSTYAPTISTILSRGYCRREKKHLIPTDMGIITTNMMSQYFKDIIDVDFTAELEEKLDMVSEGAQSWLNVISDFYDSFEDDYKIAEEEINKIEIVPEVSDVECDKCGRLMVYKDGRFGKFLACPGFPDCRNVKSITKETGVTCNKCGKKILEKKSQKGRKYYGCEGAPECDVVLWNTPVDQFCELCGSIKIIKSLKNGDKILCSNKECERSKARG